MGTARNTSASVKPRLPLAIAPEHSLRLQISLWKDGLPVDALPQEGWIEVSTAEPIEWPL
jgi:hypothetical protein